MEGGGSLRDRYGGGVKVELAGFLLERDGRVSGVGGVRADPERVAAS
jgi:hypothetical protein